MIEDVLGDHIFLRPDSSLKPFTGFDCKLQDLPFEISAHSQTDHVAPGELVFLCKAQEMPEDEYRVWLIDGNIVSHSSYSWDKDRPHVPAPDEVLDSAADLAQIMEPTMTAFTADFAVMEDGVKIVELNGISTSGWYGATNPSCLIDNMRESFWPESFSR